MSLWLYVQAKVVYDEVPYKFFSKTDRSMLMKL